MVMLKRKTEVTEKKIGEMNLAEFLDWWRQYDNKATIKLEKRIDNVLNRHGEKIKVKRTLQ